MAATLINCSTPEQVYAAFGFSGDYTEEFEQQVRSENSKLVGQCGEIFWAFVLSMAACESYNFTARLLDQIRLYLLPPQLLPNSQIFATAHIGGGRWGHWNHSSVPVAPYNHRPFGCHGSFPLLHSSKLSHLLLLPSSAAVLSLVQSPSTMNIPSNEYSLLGCCMLTDVLCRCWRAGSAGQSNRGWTSTAWS